MYTFFTDTDCDVSLADAKKYGIKLISMPYSIGTETVYPYEDYEVFDDRSFYDLLRTGVLPNTSSISEERYISYFEPEFAAGRDVLYVHFSRAMSQTFENCERAVEKLKAKYPERKFYSADTMGITTISRYILYSVLEDYHAGASAEEICEKVKDEAAHTAMIFFADDLKFFRHSGRVSGLTAMMGTLLGIRPIIYMSPEGKMESIGTAKGRAKAIDRLVSAVEENGVDVASRGVMIGHTDAPELADEIAGLLKEKFGADLDVQTVVVNPTAGAHCGPNGVGVAFHAASRKV